MPETTGNGRQDQGAKRRRIASSNSKGAKKLSAGQSKALKAPSAVQPAKGSSQAIIDKAVFKPLPKKYSLSPTSEWERLIVIGDVHGMIEALEALLKCIGFKSESDHLIFVGDMITKGRKTEPSDSKRSSEEVAIEASKDVLKFAIEHEASAVLGNHEDIILNAGKKGYKESLKRTLDGEFKEKKYLRTSKESEKALDKALYNALSRKEKSWLEELPHVLDLGKVGGRDKMVVVHAGLNPTLGLKEQIALETMNLKTIDPSGSTSSMHKGDKEVEKYLKSDEDKQLFAQMVPWFQVCMPVVMTLPIKSTDSYVFRPGTTSKRS